ncbi:MAG: carboxypeptidase-like regulatory domain-containing protein, partial [Ferruginibacter sp.]
MRNRLLFIKVWLLVALLPLSLFSQNKMVTGLITAGKNMPVQGATISTMNSSQASVSDAQGKFSMSVPENAVLLISASGYKTQTINVTQTSDMRINLSEDVSRLDEVVVTGLSTSVKRKNLANAVAVINAKELNETAPAQTFDAALEGK